MAIKKFEQYKKEKDNESNVIDHHSENDENGLADDVTELKTELDKVVKLEDGEYFIDTILDVSLDNPMDSDEELKESATVINAEFSDNIKRGDVIYITARIKKNNYTAFNSMCVVSCRIVDIWQGLSKLSTLR